jgi:hypothetical protein
MGKTTINALVARGFDSEMAKIIDSKGYTLNALKNMNTDDLRGLGIPEKQIKMILNESRPPIPQETVIKVLHNSRWTCCICRDRTQGIVIHHINEYSNSRSHHENNLVVLCPNHHSEAHTKRDLQLNLTSERLKESKKMWVEFVRKLDFHEVFDKTPTQLSAVWDYFNHRRLIDLSQGLGIDVSKLKNYATLLEESRINIDGTPAWANPDLDKYMYDFLYTSRDPYVFYSDLMKEILSAVNWVKLYPDSWNRSFINSVIKENSIVVCKGAVYFKDLKSSQPLGANQMREGLRRCNGIRLKFQFDAWETTSSSAHDSHLSGRNVSTLVCLIRSKSRVGKDFILNSTVLAIGNGFGPPCDGWHFYEDEGDFE